jgi:hypothetical protein
MTGINGDMAAGSVQDVPANSVPSTDPPKHFHGTVELDPSCLGHETSRISEEVIAHLSRLASANVKVTLEISADVPQGVPDNVVRTVLENSTNLKFTSKGFEAE